MSHDGEMRNLKFKKRFEGKIRYINKETGLLGALMDNITSHPTRANSTKISFGLPSRATIDVHPPKSRKTKQRPTNISLERENKNTLNILQSEDN